MKKITKVLLVKDIMTKNPVNIPIDATIMEAAKVLHQGEFSGAAVVDPKGKLVGVISEKDLFKALYPSYEDYFNTGALVPTMDAQTMQDWLKEAGHKSIKPFIAKHAITTAPETPLVKVGAIMLAQGIHRLPVMAGEKIVGIITRRNLYRAIFNHLFGFKAKKKQTCP